MIKMDCTDRHEKGNVMIRVFFICLLAQLFLINDVYAVRNYTSSDIFSMTRVSQIAISSDGKEVAYVTLNEKNTSDGKAWNYSLYFKDNDGKTHLLINDNKDKIASPVFSPNDNAITYLMKGKKFQSIWTYDIKTAQSKKLIEFQNNISSFKYSPNGEFIAFMSEDSKVKNKVLMPVDVSKPSANGRLYLVDLKNPSTIKPITSDNISVSQFFVYPGFDWSPDSQSIVFSYQPQSGDQYSMENKIAILDLKTGAIKNIAYSDDHNSSQPIYSHDGKYIAFEANPSKSEVEKQYPTLKPNEPSPIRLTQTANNKICIYTFHLI